MVMVGIVDDQFIAATAIALSLLVHHTAASFSQPYHPSDINHVPGCCHPTLSFPASLFPQGSSDLRG
jgi:hypothetical protein